MEEGVKSRIIGIVGGMGPAAGLDLSGKVISQTIASRDQEHLPQLLYSFPSEISDRSDFILGSEQVNPAYAIVRTLLQMEQSGAVVAGLACNSAHASPIFDVVREELEREASNIRLLHLVEEVALFIRQHFPGMKRVGVLGTTGTYVSRLYDMMEGHGLMVADVSEKEQARIHRAIYHPLFGVKSLVGVDYAEALNILKKACQSLKERGAQLLVFGCSEFPLIYKESSLAGLPVIDANLVLARALIQAVAPEKLKPWHP